MDASRSVEKTFDCTIIVVKWDEMAGPTIIDIQPPEKREMMESVAVQIYFSGVAVFGHEWTPQRAELSFPLVSLGPEYMVKVGFDAWSDPEVRGGYRPFYIGFVMTHEIADVLEHFINLRLPTYLDELKSSQTINLQRIYAEMIEYFDRLNATLKQEAPLQEVFETAHAYTVKDAQQDLDEAIQLWNADKNIESGWKAERAALFLEKFDPKNAGEAYFFVGNVYFHHNEFVRAMRAFQQAAKNYLKAEKNDNAAKAYYLAGTSAAYIKQLEEAETYFKQAINWTTDEPFLVDLHLSLAKVHESIKKWNKALENYQEALNLAEKLQNMEKKAEIHHAKSILYRNMEKDLTQSDAVYLLEIQKSIAEELERAAESWMLSSNNYKAAVAFLQSARQYVRLNMLSHGIKAYQNALHNFYQIKGLFNKAQNILQLSELLRKDITRNNVKNDEATQLLQQLLEVETKLIEDLEKKPAMGHANFEKDFLLSNLLIDKAKLCQYFNDKLNQVSSLERAKKYLSNHPAFFKLKILTFLQLANLYYELEFYSLSFQEYDELVRLIHSEHSDSLSKTLESLQLGESQFRKILQNYFVCAQQLSHVFYHAALAALSSQSHAEAISHFKQSLDVLLTLRDSKYLSMDEKSLNNLDNLIKTRIQRISEKIPFLTMPNTQVELTQLIERTMKVLEPHEHEDANASLGEAL